MFVSLHFARRWVLLASLSFLLISVWATSALAQSVTINEASIRRKNGFRKSSQEPLWINRADCLADDRIYFPVTVSNFSNYQLEVWVGSGNDCRPAEARRTTTAVCWQVWKGVPTSTGLTVEIAVRDIVARVKPGNPGAGPGVGTQKHCEWTQSTTAPLAADMYFMFIDTGSEAQVGGTVWKTKFDLAGPTAPRNVTAGVGDSLLVVKWDESTDGDKTGYRFYCDPKPKVAYSDEATDLVTARTTAALPYYPLNGDAGIQDVDIADTSDDATTNDASASTDAADDVSGVLQDASAPAPNPDCPTTVLIAGTVPDEAYRCGSASLTASSGYAKGLENNVTYSVGVAAVDKIGNVGKLSNVTCLAPRPVDDFFKVYRQRGGRAGGGFCTVRKPLGAGKGGAGEWLGMWVLVFAVCAVSWIRRETRR